MDLHDAVVLAYQGSEEPAHGQESKAEDDYNRRYTAMQLAVTYAQGRSIGWPNLKGLAEQIDTYLTTGK